MDIQKHYDSVEKFNDIAENFTDIKFGKLQAQMKVVVEEIKELETAFDNQDAVELLDGACDGFVTLMGLIQQMERVGFKVGEALQRVNDNNLGKYPRNIYRNDLAIYDRNGWDVNYNFKYNCYVLKDRNGKIRKPHDFQAVVLDDLVPEGFFGGTDE